MEICVNEYARINKDFRITCLGIGKVVNKNQNTIYIKMSSNDLPIAFNVDSIAKHCFNIIDLIEKDDYINGCRVYEVEEQGVTTYQQTECSGIDYNWIHKSEIKDIVTKEQFNSIKYEVV